MYKQRETDFVQSLNASIQGQPWLPVRRTYTRGKLATDACATRETEPPAAREPAEHIGRERAVTR